MESIFIHFCSNFPAKLKVNDLVLGTLENQTDTLLIETNCEKSFELFVLPISNSKFLPSASFLAEIKIKGKNIFCESPQLEITKFDENIFEVFIKPMTLVLKSPKKVVQKFEPTKNLQILQIEGSFSELEIHFFEQTFFCLLPEKIMDAKCEFFEQNSTKILTFQGKTCKNQDFMIIFENFFCKHQILCDVLENKKNEILALSYAKDIANHGIVKKFLLEKNGYVLKEEYVVFCEENPNLPENDLLIPLAFVQAVNLEDFKLARSFLDENLSKLLSDETLKDFFGDFEEFKWNNHTNKKNVVCFVFDGNPKTVTNFEFEMKNKKITNITKLD